MPEDTEKLLESLRQCIGKPVGPYYSWDPVNAPMIRHWCEAMGDSNPVYTQPDVASESVHGELVAPPTMLQVWSMVGYGGQQPPGSSTDEPMPVVPILQQNGYPAVVATNCEQEYIRYLKLGDTISTTSEIEDVSDQKTTALGTGFFVTQLINFYVQGEELVGQMRFRLFLYRPTGFEGQADE